MQRSGTMALFGMAHGLIFIALVVAALLTGIAFEWALATWLPALLGSILPLCSVIFLIWADRTGRIGETGAFSPVAQPGGPAADTT